MNTRQKSFTSVEEAVVWLKSLNESVNKKVNGRMTPNMSGKGYEYTRLDRVRDLTKKEWEQVVALVRQYQLPCELASTGFTWMLHIYGHSPLREERPDLILVLVAEQVPLPGTRGNLGEKETALTKLAWLTHSARNKELLEWYQLEQPRESSHYTY